MGIVSTALGAQIKRGPNLELSINLTKFITNFCEEVFTRTGTRPNNKPTMCPNSTKHPSTFARAENGKLSKAAAKFPMREIVRNCLWIVGWCRPDITWTVGILSIFVSCYDKQHMKLALRLVCYLYSTRDYCITYTSEVTEIPKEIEYDCEIQPLVNWHPRMLGELIAYSDADFAQARDCKSTTGYIIYFAGGPLVWKSNKQ